MDATTPAQGEWAVSGSDCCAPFSTCLLAWCVPCVLYGRIHHRIHKDGQLKDWNFANADCCGWYALACCGCQWIVQMMQRGDMRKKYGLKGDGFKDCLCACCCTPCDLMQQDKEAEIRENERAGLVSQQPVNKESMNYQAPGQQHQHQQPAIAAHDPYAQVPPSKEANEYHAAAAAAAPAQVASPAPAYGQPQQPMHYGQAPAQQHQNPPY